MQFQWTDVIFLLHSSSLGIPFGTNRATLNFASTGYRLAGNLLVGMWGNTFGIAEVAKDGELAKMFVTMRN